MSLHVRCGLASKANAKTPAASGAAAEVPEWVRVHLPYKSVVATPVFGSLAPLEKVEAKVEEQLSS